MAWAFLIVAGLCEVGWTTTMKYTRGFTRPGLSALTVGISIVGFVLLAQAMKSLPVGLSYAVWTGIGAVGSTILGIVLFSETSSPARIACIALIVIGIVGLRLTMNP
jgi:quaternary ammonium compound-resistance protein SugE